MRNERKEKKERSTRKTREVREEQSQQEQQKKSKIVPAAIFLALAVILAATLFGGDTFLSKVQLQLMGKGAPLLPFTFLLIAGKLFFDEKYIAFNKNTALYVLFILCTLGTAHALFVDAGNELDISFMKEGGGVIGGFITVGLSKVVGKIGTWAVLAIGWLAFFAMTMPLGKIKELLSKSSDDEDDMELEVYEPKTKADTSNNGRTSIFKQQKQEQPFARRMEEHKAAERAKKASTQQSDSDVMSVYKNKNFGSFTKETAPENKVMGTFRSILGNKEESVYDQEPVKQQIQQDPVQLPSWQDSTSAAKQTNTVLVPKVDYDDIAVQPVPHNYVPPEELFPVEPPVAESVDIALPSVSEEESAVSQETTKSNGGNIIHNMYRPVELETASHTEEKKHDSETVTSAVEEKDNTARAVVTGAAAMAVAGASTMAAHAGTAAANDAAMAALTEVVADAESKLAETTAAAPESKLIKTTTTEPKPAITIVNSADQIKTETVQEEKVQEVQAEPNAYRLPSLDLLNPVKKSDAALFEQDVMAQCAILEKTLADFKVKANVVNVTRGPSVTRFELEPAPGVKVASVVNLADDIALRLAANGVRIEAPIPGKSAIGIEAPNTKNDMVCFREVVQDEGVRNEKSPLCIGLGKDISGNIITCDIAKMPHMLVAGSTGSGKSVCINTIIAGILYKANPDEVKLILVDPKVVELSNYNGIPHLLTPVVTEPKKAASALHWAVGEMEKRYQMFADQNVRNIETYNNKVEQKLPFIVIIIDELSDLMMVAKVDVEDAILRLAQKARAAGIHLILATQRPSVDVITGIVKANIPSRIAFAVSSQTDSRTILDTGGAEKLLGKGDMLFKPISMNTPVRVQGAFVTDEELAAIVDSIKNQSIPVEYTEEVTEQPLASDAKNNPPEEKGNTGEEAEGYYEDDLFEDALRLVLDMGTASSSMLQRRFRIGYTRAARMVDMMEEYGIVGQSVGSKPREVIMSRQEVEERFLNHDEQ